MAQESITPATLAPNREDDAARATTTAGKRPISRRMILIGAVVLLLAAAAIVYFVHASHYEGTDDAQVDGNISNVSPRTAGFVIGVHVIENQTVKAGDLLAELDTTDLELAADQAKAQVAQAQAQLEAEDPTVPITLASNKSALTSARSDLAGAQAALSAARKEVAQLMAQLAQAEANDRTAQLEMERSRRLLTQGAVSQSDFDTRSNAAIASSANLEALRQSLAAASDRVAQQQAQLLALHGHFAEIESNAPQQMATRQASVLWRQASLELAKAQLAQAEKNLQYARILAPVTGIVAKKAIAVGDHVAPGQEVIALTETGSLWVTANFRETQLQRMRPGQSVRVHVDALNADLRGTVESVGSATGSRLSVLPPENASGNYVKVVQRIPVRIQFEPGQDALPKLRIGMSVEPEIAVQ